METTTPNVELLEKTYAHIEANPRHWRQEVWRCNTGMCFAGWAAELAGGEWLTKPSAFSDVDNYFVPEPDDPDIDVSYDLDVRGRRGVHVEYRAQRVLRISEDDAEALFDGGNDLDDLRRIIDDIKARVE